MLKRYIDTWTTNNYRVYNESETKSFQNESEFQQAYASINTKLSPKVLCIIEGRWSKDNALSVNGRFYGKFWRQQLAKEETQYILRKGLMWMQFGHVDRGIEDKDLEKGLVAGIVTHLQVIEQPTTINGRQYEKDDLFGRAIVISTCAANSGEGVYALLSVGSEISISSRGLGEYIVGETHTCEDGSQVPIMNPDTYELETFDFTRLPGISCAEVHTVKDNLVPNDMPNNGIPENDESNEDDDFTFESLEVSDNTKELINESLDSLIFNIKDKENTMAKVDGIKVQQVLEEANAKIASLSAKLEEAEEERDAAIAKADELEKKLDEQPEETPEKTESVDAGTAPEEPVENPAPVKADAEAAAEPAVDQVDTTELEKFKAIADTPEELEATLVEVQETLRKCEDDAEELEKVKADNAKLEEELKEKEDEVQEACKALESYTKLGSIASLKAMVESAKKIQLEARRQKLAQFTEHYSVKKGITQESVKRIIESSKSFKDARSILEGLPNADVNKNLYKGESVETKVVPTKLQSFAESMIDKMEARRAYRVHTAE